MATQPLYMEVYQDLLKLIMDSENRGKFVLPTERELCERYRVSRSTIRSALVLLKKSGHTYTLHGSGTYVRTGVIEQKLQNLYSFSDELKCNVSDSSCTIVDCTLIPAYPALAQKLDCGVGDRVHRLIRLRSMGETPLLLETTYLPQSRFFRINLEAVRTTSLYEFLQSTYSLNIAHAVETLQPLLPGIRERELPHIKHTQPCMLLERYAYEDEAIVEYSYSVVRGDRYVFRVDLNGHPRTT